MTFTTKPIKELVAVKKVLGMLISNGISYTTDDCNVNFTIGRTEYALCRSHKNGLFNLEGHFTGHTYKHVMGYNWNVTKVFNHINAEIRAASVLGTL